ncbi:hypothetical protein GLOIN_2v1786507 [Rhizophagus clarus]|uniref:RRM domain-containing protein n=1 Tax=Rhizophagus clarus TaxID=94130 RepID=A0A8H3KYS0_9GLOM|nr:hypothetical protein GLOIN_2v1786507 [Rhizophagus clarus]
MLSRKSIRLANRNTKNQPKVVVPAKKLIVIIPAPSIASSTSFQPNNQGTSAEGLSITVKKEIMVSNAKPTLAEEQAIAKKIALTSNLESECSLAGDFVAEKKDGPLEDGADHPVFKLRLDRITFQQINNSVKKQTTFTCYVSDSNEDAMVTDPPNQEDQQIRSNGLFKKRQTQNIDQQPSDLKMDVDLKLASQQVNNKPVDQSEIITLSDDEDSFILIPKLFIVYTESNNLSYVRKTDKAHEAIFSNEDSYNKVLQERFHTKINEKDQDEHTIQIFDIPLYTEKKTIQNSFNLLGEIEKINTRAQGVTPILLSEEQRDQQKQYSLRLSGLPIGTTAINLKPILDEMNVITCFIPKNPFHYKPFIYAYVNFKNEEDKEIAMKKKFSIKQGKIDKPLFISDPTIKRNICNNCDNPDHLYAGCNIKKRLNKRNNTVKAAWKKRTKLTAQNKNKLYAQVVKSNATPTNPHNRNNAHNQNKNNSEGKNPIHINNTKSTTTHSSNNKPQPQGINQTGPNNHNKNLSDKQQQYLHSLVDNLVKTLEVQIT